MVEDKVYFEQLCFAGGENKNFKTVKLEIHEIYWEFEIRYQSTRF